MKTIYVVTDAVGKGIQEFEIEPNRAGKSILILDNQFPGGYKRVHIGRDAFYSHKSAVSRYKAKLNNRIRCMNESIKRFEELKSRYV